MRAVAAGARHRRSQLDPQIVLRLPDGALGRDAAFDLHAGQDVERTIADAPAIERFGADASGLHIDRLPGLQGRTGGRDGGACGRRGAAGRDGRWGEG